MKKPKKLVRENYGGEEYAYYPLGKYIVSCPEVCQGRPTFKYTRITVAGILSMLKNGETVDALVADYRGRFTREAVLEAIEIAARALENAVAKNPAMRSPRKRARVRAS